MAKLMKAELFKLKKCVGLRVCLIVFLSFSVIQWLIVGFFDINFNTGFYYFESCMTSLYGGSVYSMLLGFLAASIITTDYKSRDIQCEIAQGYSRSSILAAKSIVYTATILIVSFVLMLLNTMVYTMINGFGKKVDGDMIMYIISAVLVTGFIEMMTYATCIFIAVTFHSKAASVALNLLVFFIIVMGLGIMEMVIDSKVFSDLITYLPFVSIAKAGQYGTELSYILLSMLVALVWGLICYLGTWAIFKKRNLR